MKICTFNSGTDLYQTLDISPLKAALKNALLACSESDVDIVVLPGGYFNIRADPEMLTVRRFLSALANKYNIWIFCGVDIDAKKIPSDIEDRHWKAEQRRMKSYGLNYFVVVAEPDGGTHIHRQRSITRSCSDIPPHNAIMEKRHYLIKQKRIYPLACGEAFNYNIRQQVLDNKVDIVVNLIHENHGFRAFHAGRYFSNNGVYYLGAGHANARNSTKHAYYPLRNQKRSSSRCDITTVTIPRLEGAIWEISSRS